MLPSIYHYAFRVNLFTVFGTDEATDIQGMAGSADALYLCRIVFGGVAVFGGRTDEFIGSMWIWSDGVEFSCVLFFDFPVFAEDKG